MSNRLASSRYISTVTAVAMSARRVEEHFTSCKKEGKNERLITVFKSEFQGFRLYIMV